MHLTAFIRGVWLFLTRDETWICRVDKMRRRLKIRIIITVFGRYFILREDVDSLLREVFYTPIGFDNLHIQIRPSLLGQFRLFLLWFGIVSQINHALVEVTRRHHCCIRTIILKDWATCQFFIIKMDLTLGVESLFNWLFRFYLKTLSHSGLVMGQTILLQLSFTIIGRFSLDDSGQTKVFLFLLWVLWNDRWEWVTQLLIPSICWDMGLDLEWPSILLDLYRYEVRESTLTWKLFNFVFLV